MSKIGELQIFIPLLASYCILCLLEAVTHHQADVEPMGRCWHAIGQRSLYKMPMFGRHRPTDVYQSVLYVLIIGISLTCLCLACFSPSGKLVQIEYALAAVAAGAPSVGIKGEAWCRL